LSIGTYKPNSIWEKKRALLVLLDRFEFDLSQIRKQIQGRGRGVRQYLDLVRFAVFPACSARCVPAAFRAAAPPAMLDAFTAFQRVLAAAGL
jgi:hypothetical protein